MTEDGRGIGKTEDNFTVFTDSAFPGDKVVAKIYKRKKNFAEAETLEITEFSEYRQDRLCPTDSECGGCDFMEYRYDAQRELKQNKVKNLIERFVNIDTNGDTDILEEIVSPENTFNYRNKAILHIDHKKNSIGYFSKKTHDVLDMKDCLINSNYSVQIKRALSDLLIQSKPKDAIKIKDVLIRNTKDGSEVMVVLIAGIEKNEKVKNKNHEAYHKAYYKDTFSFITQNLVSKFPNIKSVVLNINNSKKFLLGKESYVLYGSSYIIDYIEDLSFKISPETFFQVNPEITEKMYSKVLEYCDLKGNEVVYDIYSGIGTISLFLSRKAKEVIGIEIVEKSVLNAIENAKVNNIENADFEYGKAEIILPKHSKSGKKADVIVVDPPRKGCDRAVLESMMEMNPEKIVYVSCNPATLARDLNVLFENYSISKIQPFDMFPWTNHVETVVLLTAK